MKKETRNENGELHSFNDQPAVEHADGTKEWYQNGRLHRLHGPAFEGSGGNKIWYQNGLKHRDDGHAVESSRGTKIWYQNGLKHRVGGPAVESSGGTKSWYQNGERHRLGGPAIEHADGEKEYWIEGEELTEREFLARVYIDVKLPLFEAVLDAKLAKAQDEIEWLKAENHNLRATQNAIRAEAIRYAASKCNPILATDDHRDQLFAYADKIERGESV